MNKTEETERTVEALERMATAVEAMLKVQHANQQMMHILVTIAERETDNG